MPRSASDRDRRFATISAMTSAVSRTSSICGQVRTSASRRCRCGHAGGRASEAGATAAGAAEPAGIAPSSVIVVATSGSGGRQRGGVLDVDRVLPVDLANADPDDLLAGGRHVLADVVRPDRKLPMAAVDEHREANR